MKQTKFEGVFESGRKVLTKNLVPGISVYGENLVKDGAEYREWDPRRSKLCAAILKGIREIGIKPGNVVLYLGASTGTTPSHVSDIVGNEGFVFALDFAPRVVRELVFLCEKRKNMTPILADANRPETYFDKVSAVDVVYMDIAQRNQAEIFLKNVEMFLIPGGYALLAVKARSVDVTKRPGMIFDQVRNQLGKSLNIVDFKVLDPFQKDHCMIVCQKSK